VRTKYFAPSSQVGMAYSSEEKVCCGKLPSPVSKSESLVAGRGRANEIWDLMKWQYCANSMYEYSKLEGGLWTHDSLKLLRDNSQFKSSSGKCPSVLLYLCFVFLPITMFSIPSVHNSLSDPISLCDLFFSLE